MPQTSTPLMLSVLNRKDDYILKKLLSVLIAALLICTNSAFVSAAPQFSENVAPLLAELKIMQGDPDGNLRLDDLVSRAECAKIAVASSSFRDTVAVGSKTSPFKDVTADNWAAPYVTVAVKNGLCKGYLDATFRPNGTVIYEEALTMFLRVLGYSEADFGSSWPDGQIGIAQNIGLCDSLYKSRGEAMTRRDVMTVVYNMLNTPAKGAGQDYLSEFDRTITDDVILTASGRDNSSIEAGKVATSVGTFKVTDSFDYSNIGKRGSISVRNNDTIVAFIPNTDRTTSRYVVYSILGDSVITYANGGFDQLDFSTTTPVYEDGQPSSYTSIAQKIAMGDVLSVKYKDNGAIDYVIYEEGNITGPVTVDNSMWYNEFGADASSMMIMRDGSRIDVSEVKINDIAYYSQDLNLFMLYSKKVTGVYESASPNRDIPSSVTVSGTSYEIESVEAFRKLSSAGDFKIGDTITLLLGKNGEIADVISQSSQNSTDDVYGYLIETGTKETTVSDSKVVKPYAKVILPSGEAGEYVTSRQYDNILNSIVKVSFKDGTAQLTALSPQESISGIFNWSSKGGTLGKNALSSDLEIIEVSTTVTSEAGAAAKVFPTRLNKLTLSDSDILYVGKNSNGEISTLILEDVTGDMHSYGIMSSVSSRGGGMSVSGSYSYLMNGQEKFLSTNNTIYNISKGQAAQIKLAANGSVTGIVPLTKTADGTDAKTDGNLITLGGKNYTMSDNITIYTKDSSYNYSVLTKDELNSNSSDYNVTLYSDKPESKGGRVRIVMAIKRN